MAITGELQGFVKDSLARGLSRPEIEHALVAAGWPSDQARGALRGFAEIEFAIPVPVPKPYLSAREAFLYLVLFSTLYVGAFNLGGLLFNLIDLRFPDPAGTAGMIEQVWDNIRWNVSLLIVASPVFLYVARLTSRELRLEPGKRGSKVRRQLIYLTLFVAASVLLGAVTGLVHGLLSGELTTRFVLKVLTVATIAGALFRYNLRDLRFEDEQVGAGDSA